MAATKNCCPKCRTKFRVGSLPTQDERMRNEKMGVVELGADVPDFVTCPKCASRLRVVHVRMGTFFSIE
ncbi:MAG: hypothetical protein HYY17_15655 [Planctomycetes bacterium]|nr:hypothetical protein [Planctomycetota bacterium]